MPAITRTSREPAHTVTVKKVVTVRADVDKLFPEKYLLRSYQFPGSLCLTSQTAYRVRALIV